MDCAAPDDADGRTGLLKPSRGAARGPAGVVALPGPGAGRTRAAADRRGRSRSVGAREDDLVLARMLGVAALLGVGFWIGLVVLLV